MAEGHAVIRWKRRLEPIVGEPLVEIKMPKRWGERPQSLLGEHVTGIETHGKHLLLNLSTGETLHCHGAQYGSWQVGERPLDLRKEEQHVRLRLATDAHEAVFFHGPTVELLTPEERAAHERLTSLGPDVLAGSPEHSSFDRDEAARRVHAEGDKPIGPVVLDQRVMAGVGNIYKSEGLFLAGIDPRRPASSVSREELDRFWDAVIPLMWEGTESWGRTKTTPPEVRAQGIGRWVPAEGEAVRHVRHAGRTRADAAVRPSDVPLSALPIVRVVAARAVDVAWGPLRNATCRPLRRCASDPRALPMPLARHIAACLALLALVGGSVVAPGLHQAAHGFEHAHAAAEAASQTDHVHTDGEGFTVSLDGVELGLHPCLLCLPQPKTPASPPATPALFTSASPFAVVAARAATAPAEAHRPIRGPPTVA